ncbi:MAG TPA: desulfoferrodoxin family protein [Spirochaetota bacterium]|nr:desulfoferrodoxin family protein [Spirochaetota bacterium]HPL18679.1 desulfoferrodoxin family protein [Spirochaetota bacterium]HQF09390.1 desulfoferrodoxin family protein [Spirochaetota bacterium]HQH97996.1 desulfoferrodoxin family protein [Spirochaetota bacterium]HQJ71113.1 desulfoferrodoxin family protein [Spirochaetota bacterium]
MQRAVIIILMTVAAMEISCGSGDRSGQDEEAGTVRFYSAADPGKWESKAADHDVEITITRVNDRKYINVHVPFAKNREKKHYVEAILLLDANRKELQKKSFARGSGEEGARFEVQDSFNDPVTVVIKCNLHDMWEKQVDWNE